MASGAPDCIVTVPDICQPPRADPKTVRERKIGTSCTTFRNATCKRSKTYGPLSNRHPMQMQGFETAPRLRTSRRGHRLPHKKKRGAPPLVKFVAAILFQYSPSHKTGKTGNGMRRSASLLRAMACYSRDRRMMAKETVLKSRRLTQAGNEKCLLGVMAFAASACSNST
jgi:hypothetical protein